MENTTKKALVEATYQLICQEGMENVTVRKITRAAGCSPANLYRHFETLDHLILIACIRLLDDYMTELIELPTNLSAYDRNLQAWHRFNRFAFANPPVYLHLFWGKVSEELDISLYEYFKLYPLESQNQKVDFFTLSVYSGNIKERDFIWLRRAANEGDIRYEDARLLAAIDDDIVRSRLLSHLEDYTVPGVAEKAADECNQLLSQLYETFRIRKEP